MAAMPTRLFATGSSVIDLGTPLVKYSSFSYTAAQKIVAALYVLEEWLSIMRCSVLQADVHSTRCFVWCRAMRKSSNCLLSKSAVSADLESKQLLPLDFAEVNSVGWRHVARVGMKSVL